jgi:steroid delta-isomerase
MKLKDAFTAYLQAYAAKDLEQVSAMLAEDILLRDWKISVTGKTAAVAETRKNFAAAESIAIEILNTYETPGVIAGELRITVDQHEVLYVVDVVTFNDESKISSIRAYIGRAD